MMVKLDKAWLALHQKQRLQHGIYDSRLELHQRDADDLNATVSGEHIGGETIIRCSTCDEMEVSI